MQWRRVSSPSTPWKVPGVKVKGKMGTPARRQRLSSQWRVIGASDEKRGRERCRDMPRKRRLERVGLLPEDKLLTGTWWRCLQHGLTEDPIILGGQTYCPRDGCAKAAVLVH